MGVHFVQLYRLHHRFFVLPHLQKRHYGAQVLQLLLDLRQFLIFLQETGLKDRLLGFELVGLPFLDVLYHFSEVFLLSLYLFLQLFHLFQFGFVLSRYFFLPLRGVVQLVVLFSQQFVQHLDLPLLEFQLCPHPFDLDLQPVAFLFEVLPPLLQGCDFGTDRQHFFQSHLALGIVHHGLLEVQNRRHLLV